MQISVITPTFNDAVFLIGNIETIKRQSHKDIEHFIVDGNSTDSTRKILEEQSNLKWISEPDNGMYDAVNKGIARCSGDIIAYLNADDEYFPYTLELVHKAFELDQDLDFVYGDCEFMNEDRESLAVFRSLEFNRSVYKYGPIRWCQPSFFCRREVFEKFGVFNTDFKNVGDYDFFKRIVHGGAKGQRLNKPISRFMMRKTSISYTQRDVYFDEISKINKEYRETFPQVFGSLNIILYYIYNLDSYCRYYLTRMYRKLAS